MTILPDRVTVPNRDALGERLRELRTKYPRHVIGLTANADRIGRWCFVTYRKGTRQAYTRKRLLALYPLPT